MSKPHRRARSWWPWARREDPAVPDAADHGTAYGLEISLMSAAEGPGTGAGDKPAPRRRAPRPARASR